MKTRIVTMFFGVFLLSFAVLSIAYAQSGMAVNVNVEADVEVRTEGNSASTGARATVTGNATSTIKRNDNSTSTNTRATTTGQINAETNRSTVATFVKSLLNIADRDGGIGVEVREIAKSQNDSATTTAVAIAEVEGRSSIKTFLIGSDYKNLGVIRSELATTSNNIARLKALLDKTTDATVRAELNVQIQALETEQARIDAYVEAHESTFSLFGWFAKLFVR